MVTVVVVVVVGDDDEEDDDGGFIALHPCDRWRDGRKAVTPEVTRPGEKVGVA